MKRHTVTEAELAEFVRTQWLLFASSGSDVSNKRLEIGMDDMFRVTDHGQVIYLGTSKGEAIRLYNEAR